MDGERETPLDGLEVLPLMSPEFPDTYATIKIMLNNKETIEARKNGQ